MVRSNIQQRLLASTCLSYLSCLILSSNTRFQSDYNGCPRWRPQGSLRDFDVCMCVCVCACVRVCIYVYVCVYIHICIYIHTYIYTYIHTYPHAHTYTYTYTHIHLDDVFSLKTCPIKTVHGFMDLWILGFMVKFTDISIYGSKNRVKVSILHWNWLVGL